MSTPKSVQSAQSQSTQSVAVENAIDGDTSGGIDSAIQGALGRKLRESYDEVVREKVPDKFMTLLDQLKKSESDKAGER
jgi:hypothetical protein